MNITKKFDRAFQWAGEKMGNEARTTMSDEFKGLETEMALRFDGMRPGPGSISHVLSVANLIPPPPPQ